MLSDAELLAYNKRGLIPAPDETEAQFLQRIRSLKSEEVNDPLIPEDWDEAHALTRLLFDFSADWVKAFYSKKQLPFWQGAVTWLGDPPLIQLHPELKKGSYLKLYHRKEVLAHEAVHAMRTPLAANRFEEYFAYLTSERSWRSKLGPLFRTSAEGSIFLCLLAFSVCASYLSIWMPIFGLLFALPWLILIIALIRLGLTHITLKRCKAQLFSILHKSDYVRFLMVRLTDKEIIRFSTLTPSAIYEYCALEKNRSLRWKMLFQAYFN